MGMAGMEVPLPASHSLKWIDVPVPTASHFPHQDTFAPPSADCASSSSFPGSPLLLVWRIHKSTPHALELFEISARQHLPTTGLRLLFPYPLSPFAFICAAHQIPDAPAASGYLLYALTVSGLAFLLTLPPKFSACLSFSSFSAHDVVELDIRPFSHLGAITSAAAAPGCLVLGWTNGTVVCFQLGTLNQSDPGFANELRDDSGFGRLWGLMSRVRLVGGVKDLIILKVHGKQVLFVLHNDGILRVWELSCYSRILSHAMSIPVLEGATPVRFWMGELNCDSGILPLAILYKSSLPTLKEAGMGSVCIYSIQCALTDRLLLSVESSVQNIPQEEGECIDVKLFSDNIWILRENGLVYRYLLLTDDTLEESRCYASQEEFIADQLFQSPEHSSEDLFSMTYSLFPSGKDQVVPFLSSIFLRKIFHPEVYHSVVLRETFGDYNKHWADSDFQSLTLDGLKKEILLLVEHESVGESPASIFYGWKNFCSRYFHYWCKNNVPCSLFVHSSAGALGVVRKNSVSLYRGLEKIELLTDGSSDEIGDPVGSGLDLSTDGFDYDILFEILRCTMSVNQHLGRTASAIFYELVMGKFTISYEEIVLCLLKILETGYGSLIGALHACDLGADVSEKELADHKNLQKFSIGMLISLRALGKKAGSWEKVLNVIESYLQFVVPQKIMQKSGSETLFNTNGSMLVIAVCQIANVMFEAALDILLFLGYLVNISGQIDMSLDDLSKIKLELLPMVQETVFEWLVILFLGTTPSESPAIEDFSFELSSLHIDGNMDKRSLHERMGKCDFTIASILLYNIKCSFADERNCSLECLPDPQDIVSSVHKFISWVIWGEAGEESSNFWGRTNEIAVLLLSHGQCDAVECLLTASLENTRREKSFKSIQDVDSDWCLLQHLLGCCLLAKTQRGLHGIIKQQKICEAVCCFFRASSGQGASQALQNLPQEAGLSNFSLNGNVSSAAWKLYYYQWAMQLFEQYNISEGACQFALAALEQVDEALRLLGDCHRGYPFSESATNTKGRLWANVFKFTLDLNLMSDAYCAIVSNPDEESKLICLRRFIIVLCEHGAIKILCDGQLPFIGLADKIEQELAWKAERSDILAKPNPYKLLYTYEMHRHNWRRAASYIYLYSARLKREAALNDQKCTSILLQERLNGLSSAINALHLVNPSYAWIDPLPDGNYLQNEPYPSKKAKKTAEEQSSGNNTQSQRLHFHIDIEKLECEFVLTLAEYLLKVQNVKWTYSEIQKAPSDLVNLLVETSLYDMAFTVVLKFWKDSGLKRELEKVFSTISFRCCSDKVSSSGARTGSSWLTLSKDEVVLPHSLELGMISQQNQVNNSWEILELYLGKYKCFHAGLPVIVAETLLREDPHIELPLWLINLFKDGRREKIWGMSGQDPSAASLFQLFVDYGRCTEATNLFLEYTQAFASMRPADVVHRKRAFAVWFPYTTLERFWCQLEELSKTGHSEEPFDKLKKLLQRAVLCHLKLLKVDSDDAVSYAVG